MILTSCKDLASTRLQRHERSTRQACASRRTCDGWIQYHALLDAMGGAGRN